MHHGIFIGAAIGIIGGNFIFQAFDAQNWALACDRSVFQAVAIFTVWISFALQSALT